MSAPTRLPAGRARRRSWTLLLSTVVLAFAFPAAGQVRTEAHLEKARYIVGEPIFVVVDVTNVGWQPVAYDGSDDIQNPRTVTLSVEGMTPRKSLTQAIASCNQLMSSFHGGGAWIVDHPPVLGPGERRAFKHLLSEYNHLSPGRYRLTAKGHVNVEWRESYAPIDYTKIPPGVAVPSTRRFGEQVDGADVEQTLDLVIDSGSSEQLNDAFAPLVFDADPLETSKAVEARRAIMLLAPPFLEVSIVRWTREAAARGDGLTGPGVEALARLATPSSRAGLRDVLASLGDPRLAPMVVASIASVAEPDDESFLRGLPVNPSLPAGAGQNAALGLGRIGSETAIAMLQDALRTAEPDFARLLLTGLAISKSGRALDTIAGYAGRAPNQQVRIGEHGFAADGGSDVCDALAMLTHVRFCVDGENDRAKLLQRLARWRARDGTTAPLYGNDACVAEEKMPFAE
jgi:hypothetical protein